MRIERHANGPRVYLLGLRVHHGLTGCVLIIIGAARHERRLIELGAALVLHDAPDFPWRLRELA